MSLILDTITKQFSKQLPFVSFRKPNERNLKGYFSINDDYHYSKNFQESGFVFAPFDDLDSSIIFLESECQVLEEVFILDHDFSGSLNDLEAVYSDEEAHIKLVEKGIEEIQKGTCKKIVLSREEVIQLQNFDLLTTFERLLKTYEDAYVYVWYHPKVGLWMGATPERLVTLEKGNFTTMALASTQPYKGSLDPEWGEKEISEHQYVVDYIVSQIKDQHNGIILSEFGVSETYTVKAGNLLHLKADITGKIDNFLLKDLLTTLHPTPAVCGLPKNKSKEFILKNERYKRTYYTGFLGEININSKTDLFVNLRCVEFKENQAIIYVGGGITAESNPLKEWQETVAKTKTIKNIL